MTYYTRFAVHSALTFGLLVSFALPAHAIDAAVKCEAAKLKTAGKYGACRLSAESKAAKRGLPADFTKCPVSFAVRWDKTETKGAGACPTNADEAAIEAEIRTHSDEIQTNSALIAAP